MDTDRSGAAIEIAAVVAALSAPGLTLAEAEMSVPHRPGLYAFTATSDTWIELGLGAPPDARPLYIGKAEHSLASRDVRTHFSTGRTGSSTLRRTLAGLLASRLELHAIPRNPERPSHFANFGLEPSGDERLSEWMAKRLRLQVWTPMSPVVLDEVETEVLRAAQPPLNLSKVSTPWKQQVSNHRASLAAEARRWAERNDRRT